jgi:hypothetical protein
MGIVKNSQIVTVTFVSFFLVSCLSGLDPLPTKPKDLTMSVSVPIGTGDFHIVDASYIGPPNINLLLNVPEFAKHSNLYFADTLPVDLSKIYEKQYPINYLAFKLNIWNDFTAVGAAKIYFTDASFSKIDSLSLNIVQGHILFNGDIINPGYTYDMVSFTQSQIETLSTAQYLIFSVRIDIRNTNTNDFQYYHLYKLTCQIGARVDFVINNL